MMLLLLSTMMMMNNYGCWMGKEVGDTGRHTVVKENEDRGYWRPAERAEMRKVDIISRGSVLREELS